MDSETGREQEEKYSRADLTRALEVAAELRAEREQGMPALIDDGVYADA